MTQTEPTTKPTELICIIDRSGSMERTRSDAQAGFNGFIDRQRALEAAECHVTLWQFDTTHDLVWPRQALTSLAPPPYELVPRGGTALNDAIGKALYGVDVSATKAANIIVVIVTDGEENSSREFTRHQIREMVLMREGLGWSFYYLGAGIDAFAESSQLGISPTTTLRGGANAQGYASSFTMMDSAVAGTRLAGATKNYTTEQQEEVAATDDDPTHAGMTSSANSDGGGK